MIENENPFRTGMLLEKFLYLLIITRRDHFFVNKLLLLANMLDKTKTSRVE